MINDRIKEIRKSKQITQHELRQRLIEQGLKFDEYFNVISKIESHKRRVFADEVKAFAVALDVSVDDLLDEPSLQPTGTEGR